MALRNAYWRDYHQRNKQRRKKQRHLRWISSREVREASRVRAAKWWRSLTSQRKQEYRVAKDMGIPVSEVRRMLAEVEAKREAADQALARRAGESDRADVDMLGARCRSRVLAAGVDGRGDECRKGADR